MYNFLYLGCYRKRHGSVLFLLEVVSLKNEGVIAVFPKITFMTSRDRKCVGGPRKWPHAVRTLLAIISFYMKSLAQKLTEKMHFS